MATKNTTINPSVKSYTNDLIIEGLRKLALQRDTLRKYASDEESDSFDEERAEQYAEDITAIRSVLVTFGDTKPLVLKSERKAKAKKGKASIKVTKAKATKVAKPTAKASVKA
jgi:hypothetical protein